MAQQPQPAPQQETLYDYGEEVGRYLRDQGLSIEQLQKLHDKNVKVHTHAHRVDGAFLLTPNR